MANKYDYNDTMKLIGKQYFNTILDNDIYNEIMSIVEANLTSDHPEMKMMYVDIFVYGYLIGKHDARTKKARKIG